MSEKTEQWLTEEECRKCKNYRPQRGVAPSGCKLTGTTLVGRRSADDENPCPEFVNKEIGKPLIFNHAGHDFILSNLKFTGKDKYRNLNYTAFLQYYDTNVQIKISRWKNSRYDNKKKRSYAYICIRINIIKIMKGEIDEDLSGFLKFLEYCFDFEIIDIINGGLNWRLKNA